MDSALTAELELLRAEAAHLRRVHVELLATVAELRAAVDKQQAHIERLVRMTFGRRSERVSGPTLFDGLPGRNPSRPRPTRRPHRTRRQRQSDPAGGATAAARRRPTCPGSGWRST